jgi:hypothetical protein
VSPSYTLSHALTISSAHKNAHSKVPITREKNDLFKHIEEVRAAGATLLSAAALCASNPGDAAPIYNP